MPILRLATKDDLPLIHAAHMRSIQILCVKDYSSEHIKSWGGRTLEDVLEKRMMGIQNGTLWTIEDEGKIHGFGQWIPPNEDNAKAYLLGLYLAPEIAGQGWGRKMLQHIENEARKANANEMLLDSTLTSVGFYEHFGYQRLSEPKCYDVGSCKIPCIPMFKTLKGI